MGTFFFINVSFFSILKQDFLFSFSCYCISLMDLFTTLALVSEYKNYGGSVPLLGILCWQIFLELREREIIPCSPFQRILLILTFYQKREPHSFKIQGEFFLFSASSRWNACGMVLWAWWAQMQPLGWEGDCLREEHQRQMTWGCFQPSNE